MYVDQKLLDYDGLDEYGYVYYPYDCIGADKRCKLHVALHGCQGQVNGLAGWDFIIRYGYTHYAATNNLVILFPQVKADLQNSGCFDFWGFTGKDYLGKFSVQGKAILGMVKALKVQYREGRFDYMAENLNNELYFFWYDFWRQIALTPDALYLMTYYIMMAIFNLFDS